jgi:DNA-binding beta-propeller fold protein YncE/uncharacterized membrane protein (GlpM family)
MKKLFIALISSWFVLLFPLHSYASGSVPYETETLSANGYVIETQTAYTPIGLFAKDSNLVNPEDIFIDNQDRVYVVDSGTKSVFVFDLYGKQLNEIGKDVLNIPTGVFVDETGNIYVADYGNEMVYRFSNDGELLAEFGKPDSPLFGTKSPYKPQKVGVDRRGNIYVIGEGSNNGIIQLSKDGAFLGYYGVNIAGGSLESFLSSLLTSETQKANMFLKLPPAPDNIAIDDKGLIYSVTEGTDEEVVKKLNVAGKNLLPPEIVGSNSFKDITVNEIGNMYVLDSSGRIAEYDSFGNLLFLFGGKDDGTNRLGLFKQPTGISVDKFGRLYVTDKERGLVQVFDRTAFAEKIHEGLELFIEGLYIESQDYWTEVLRLNSSFGLAHTAMGKAYFKQQEFDLALNEFKLAEDKGGYSEAYWEVRHKWLQNNLSTIFMIIFAFFLVRFIVLFIDKRKGILNPVRSGLNKITGIKLVKELLFGFKFFRHPIDSFYYLKWMKHASILSATILYIIMFVEVLIAKFATGFVFSSGSMARANLFMEIVLFFGPLALFIVCNYLISTINDGEGRLKDIYVGTIYSFVPYLVFILPLTLISNFLTLNEAFVYDFSIMIIYGWSLIILVIMIKEIHNFTISETIRNIFMTIFAMIILVLVIFIIYVLIGQVFDFVYSIVQEVILRV